MSLRFQADADLNFDIVRAIRRREPAIDFASAVESNLQGLPDPGVLSQACDANRVLVSHDRRTMLNHFRRRIADGRSSPGVLLIPQHAPISGVVEAMITLWSVAHPDDLRDQVYHLPSLFRHVFFR